MHATSRWPSWRCDDDSMIHDNNDDGADNDSDKSLGEDKTKTNKKGEERGRGNRK